MHATKKGLEELQNNKALSNGLAFYSQALNLDNAIREVIFKDWIPFLWSELLNNLKWSIRTMWSENSLLADLSGQRGLQELRQ